MKKKNRMILFGLLTFFGLLLPLSGETSVITVKKIKLEIGDDKYIWEDEVPEAFEDAVLTPSTVLSFTGLRPGRELTEDALVREIALFQARMNESGLFFSASVSIIPPRRYPESRTIVVKAEPGFLWRFGGGSFFGYIGNKSIGGERFEWGLAAGPNTVGVSFIFHDLFGMAPGEGLYFHPSISYENSLFRETDEPWHSFNIETDLGTYITPDILVGFGGAMDKLLLPESEADPEFEYEVSAFGFFNLPRTNILSGDLLIRTPVRFSGGDVIPSAAGLGRLEQKAGAFRLQECAGAHRVWGGGESDRLSSSLRTLPENTTYFVSALGAYTLFEETLFSIFQTSLSLFCFAEGGAVRSGGGVFSGFQYGTGAGLELVFHFPIYITCEFFINTNNTGSDLLGFRIRGDF